MFTEHGSYRLHGFFVHIGQRQPFLDRVGVANRFNIIQESSQPDQFQARAVDDVSFTYYQPPAFESDG